MSLYYQIPKTKTTNTKPKKTHSENPDSRKRMRQKITRPKNRKKKVGHHYAMYVPMSISVSVETAWGDILHTNLPNVPHGEGDYLVCRTGADGEPDLSDVWVLNGVVFPEYYENKSDNELAYEGMNR